MVAWLLCLAVSSHATDPTDSVSASVGLAELFHVEPGWHPAADRVVHLRAGAVVFNVLVGPGGLLVQARGGVLVYADGGPAAKPNPGLSAGYAF